MKRIFVATAVLLVAVAVLGTVVSTPPTQAQAPATRPQLPLAIVDTTLPVQTGTTISVAAGGNLQASLDIAQPGDVISLQAGATFTGTFTLPVKVGDGWVIVRSSAAGNLLPSPGIRMTPSYADAMPKIVGTGSPVIALQTAPGAHHFRFIGIEFRPAAAAFSTGLIRFGTGIETSTADLPHDLIIDRCYIHGDAVVGGRRGITLNSRSTAVIDSYVSDWKEVGADSQAIAGWNGPGPFRIANNHLEGAGENVMFGGADPKIVNLVPSDIEIVGNHFTKPLSWMVGDPSYGGTNWEVKNLFELKNARRVLVADNLFEHHWVDAQSGFAINVKSVNQDGTAPWSVTEDVTFIRNVLRNTPDGIKVAGWSDQPGGQTKRVMIEDNYFNIDGPRWGGDGTFLMLLSAAADVTVNHNTSIQDGSIVFADGLPSPGFVFLNNIAPHNAYGIKGSGTAIGNGTLVAYFPSSQLARNVIVGADAASYPTDNFFPPALSGVQFEDLEDGNYRLSASSPYKNAGTDGHDPGADFDSLAAAFAAGGAPAPTPTSGPTPTATSSPTATSTPTPPTAQNVVWVNLANTTDTGNSLRKTGGCDGCTDAGATSQQQIASGDGWVEFTASEVGPVRHAGLSTINNGTGAAKIDFDIRLANVAKVRERGVVRAQTPYASGDVFRVSIEGGVVRYRRNGQALYTSSVTPMYPLRLDASLETLNSTITNAVIFAP